MGAKRKNQPLTVDQVEAFENRLYSSLPPIDPNRQFVDRLRNRLVYPATITLEVEHNVTQVLLLVGLILTFISMMLLAGVWLLRLIKAKR